MAIPTKPLEEMFRDVLASLQAGTPGRPVFTLLLGSGFSFPIVPTPTQMVKSDIAWWRFCKDRRRDDRFRHRADVIAAGEDTAEAITDYEKDLWKGIGEKKKFPIGTDGLPDLTDPESIGRAYQAVMSDALISNRMRRQHLRDAIARSYPKVNGAHIFLASILEAQETWPWRAPFCRTIFTTNFDPLLQRSLQLVNKLYYMTDRPEVLDAPDDDQSDAIHLVYTHGSVHRYELLNTGDQIDKARRQNAANLVDYFERHGVIVIGYSGWRDTTMEALSQCASFDSNLYWCDVHPADQAEARLRPEVLEILRAGEKNAYYVAIPSADEAMRQLHRALNLGEVPKFILNPVGSVIEQLKSIQVSADTASAERTTSGSSMASLLSGTLDRLEVARAAFEDPSIVKPLSAEGADEVSKALIARLLSEAYVADSEGRRQQAIALWSTVIDDEHVSAHDRAEALFNRGIAYGDEGQREAEINDYTEILGMPDAPAPVKALAQVNRGWCHRKNNEMDKAVDDYSAVIASADVASDTRARALVNRAIVHGLSGKLDDSVRDLTAVIAMEDLPDDIRGDAFLNRAWAQFANGGNVPALIDDSRKALELAPFSATARMNLGLGLLLTGDIDSALAEYRRFLGYATPEKVSEAIADLQTELAKLPPFPAPTAFWPY